MQRCNGKGATWRGLGLPVSTCLKPLSAISNVSTQFWGGLAGWRSPADAGTSGLRPRTRQSARGKATGAA
eukprot:15470747-Alexandrium_andersonii.AAC.1